MLKTIFFFSCLLVLTSIASGQKNIEDVIYLKNTGVIRGKILQPSAEGIVKIEIAGGSIFVFQQQEIDSIKKENRYKNKLQALQEPYFRKDQGYRNITEASLLYGPGQINNANTYYYYYSTNPDDVGISIHTINGYQFYPYLFIGAGVGIDRFITYQQTFSPFYARVQSEFLKKKISPYIYGDAGYSFMWKQHSSNDVDYLGNRGGLYLAAGAGVRICTRTRAAVLISVGYKYNTCETNWTYGYGVANPADFYTINRTYQRLVINIGVSF